MCHFSCLQCRLAICKAKAMTLTHGCTCDGSNLECSNQISFLSWPAWPWLTSSAFSWVRVSRPLDSQLRWISAHRTSWRSCGSGQAYNCMRVPLKNMFKYHGYFYTKGFATGSCISFLPHWLSRSWAAKTNMKLCQFKRNRMGVRAGNKN